MHLTRGIFLQPNRSGLAVVPATGLLASGAAGLVAVAAAGLFLTLHSTSPSVAAPAATPISTPQPPASASAPSTNRGQPHGEHRPYTPVRRIGTIRRRGPHRQRLNNRVRRLRNRVHWPRSSRVHRRRNTSNISRLTASPQRPFLDWVYLLPIHLGHRTHRDDDSDGIEPAVMPASPLGDRQVVLTDIGRRLDHLPIGPVHRRVVVAIGLGLFFEVYEIFLSCSIATALHQPRRWWDVPPPTTNSGC